MSRSNEEYEIISDTGGLKDIGPRWDRLAANFPTPLLSHRWFYSAAVTLHPHDELHVVLKTSSGDLLAAAPMVKRKRHGFISLEFIGSDTLREPSGLLYREPRDLRGVLNHLAGSRLPIYFDSLADPVLAAELSVMPGVDFNPGSRNPVPKSPWIRMAGSWDDYYQGIAPSWRSARRRAMKKATAAGRVEFEFLCPGPENFDALMEDFVLVEGEGWKGRLGTALRNNVAARRFFESFGAAAARDGMLRLAFMRVDGRPVAAQYAVECCGKHWLLKIGYDEKWSFCSPGILLMYAALERAFDDRLETFEFLGSNEPWIRIWPHKLRQYHPMRVDPSRARRTVSRALAATGKIRRRILTNLARLPHRG